MVEDSLVLVGFSVLARYFRQKHQDNLPKSKKCMAENPSHKLSSLPIATTRENTSKLYVAYKNSLKFWLLFTVHWSTFTLRCLINIPPPPPILPKSISWLNKSWKYSLSRGSSNHFPQNAYEQHIYFLIKTAIYN